MKFLPALLATAVLLLVGCGSAAHSAHSHLIHYRTMLRWDVVGISDVPTLDPALVSDPTSISVASLVYGGLVRLDSHLRVQPDGAERWTIAHGGTVYTFTLRPNLRYADGRAVTAADFAAAIKRALGPDGSAGAASFYLGAIVGHGSSGSGTARARPGIKVIDSRTLSLTLSHPSAHFLSQLAFPASFIPEPTLVTRYGPNWTDHAAGFGPYRVKAWSHTRFLTLERNPYYWNGTPSLRRITLRFYPQAAALHSYDRGGVDVVSGLPVGQTLTDLPRGAVRVPGLALDYLAFNTARSPFHRLNARRAFAAVWRPSFLGQTIPGGVFKATGFLPESFGIPTLRWQPSASPAIYLSRARYPHGQGFPPIVLITPRDSGITQLANRLVREWHRRLGVTVVARPLDLASYGRALSTHAYTIALVRWGADYADPQDFLGTQLGSSPENITGWSTRAYNAAVSLADSYAPTDSRRTSLFRRAARLAALKLPLLPLDQPAVTALLSPSLHDIALTPLGTVVGEWGQAYLRATGRN